MSFTLLNCIPTKVEQVSHDSHPNSTDDRIVEDTIPQIDLPLDTAHCKRPFEQNIHGTDVSCIIQQALVAAEVSDVVNNHITFTGNENPKLNFENRQFFTTSSQSECAKTVNGENLHPGVQKKYDEAKNVYKYLSAQKGEVLSSYQLAYTDCNQSIEEVDGSKDPVFAQLLKTVPFEVAHGDDSSITIKEQNLLSGRL